MSSKPSLRLFTIALLWLLLPTVAVAASVKLDVNTECVGAVYKIGDEVKFLVRATSDEKTLAAGTVQYVLSEDGVNTLGQGSVELGPQPSVVVGRMTKPGFLRCQVSYQPKGEDGKKPPRAVTAMAGAAVSPEQIKMSLPVPDDFDAFWAGQKKKLADMPMESTLTPVDSGSEKMECFDVQVNCPGGAPVSGYFGRPKDAKPKSLPAVLWVHGAGVCSSNLTNAKKAQRLGMLSMDLNAHGIPNGKPTSYYANRNKNDLQGYPHRGRESRETLYFNGMFLRLMRAIDFLASQPEWDGKTFIVVGHSQGGAQALAAGGLDERVTFIATGVPAMCDHSGAAIGRIAGWPKIVPNGADGKPDAKILEATRYIDCVNLATRAKADAIMSVGFIDVTCPATTCYAAYNQLRGKKEVINEPKMGHAAPSHIHKAFEKAFRAHAKQRSGRQAQTLELIFFTSNGKIGAIHPDGTGKRVFDFSHMKQRSWQPGIAMPDGWRIIVWSQDYPKNPNATFYEKDGPKYAATHLWRYDMFDRTLEEIKIPPLIKGNGILNINGILPDGRLLVMGELDGNDNTKIFTCDRDGGDMRLIHDCGGFAYGFSFSPDKRYVAFHGCKNGYEIFSLELATGKVRKLASDPDLLMFGTSFSPDSQWILYQSCEYKNDPSHDRSDLRISRPDGSETRVLDHGQRHWFGTSFGPKDDPAGGSNHGAFSPDGKSIAYTRLLPGSRTAWVHRPDREDTDHFNRDFDLSAARGGTELCLIDADGKITTLTQDTPPVWNWRPAWSPDGKHLVFTRAAAGETSSLWIIDADGKNLHKLCDGFEGKNVDFPSWRRFTKNSSLRKIRMNQKEEE